MGELSPKIDQRSPGRDQLGLSRPAVAFVGCVIAAGAVAFAEAAIDFPHHDWLRFAFLAAVACIASGWKVRFPGVVASLSMNFFFNLLAAVEMGFNQAIVIAGLSALVQSYWRPTIRPAPVQIWFNVCVMALSSGAAALSYHSALSQSMGLDNLELVPRIALAAAVQFGANCVLVSGIVVLTESRRLLSTVVDMCWSFPYYFVASLAAALFHVLSAYLGWQSALLFLPAAYIVHRSFRIYLDRRDAQRRHAEQMSALQMRTIEALALAIECKDETTHQHLGRVQVYALEVARELGLNESETEAVRAASVLHDIGKLAVPESIINKPGKLTPDEFNKMKIHPGVGAQILSSVQFPYPVVPYVRSHHEKWDGKGYPDGLQGEDIPIGARIIAAVDCLDALASDRQYRRAMPLDKAMEIVIQESGRAFDPKIVEILARNYVQFEQKAKERTLSALPKLDLDMKVERGDAPGAGFAHQPASSASTSVNSLIALASVQQQQTLIDETMARLKTIKGSQLDAQERGAVYSVRLRPIIPHHALAVFELKEKFLLPVCCVGDDASLLATLRLPVGQGLSGWVAENRQRIVNGNPAVEPGYAGGCLRSALSVPLLNSSGGELYGVLTLYSRDVDAFSMDHSYLLEAALADWTSETAPLTTA